MLTSRRRNKDIMYKNGELASIVKQRLGKKELGYLIVFLVRKRLT
jgi:hypothetical protein